MINIFHLHNFPFKNISEWTAKSNLEFKKKENNFFLCKKVNIMKRQQQCKQNFFANTKYNFFTSGLKSFLLKEIWKWSLEKCFDVFTFQYMSDKLRWDFWWLSVFSGNWKVAETNWGFRESFCNENEHKLNEINWNY